MHSQKTIETKHGQHVIRGRSIAGQETCLEFPSLEIAFDIGRCPTTAVQASHVFLTHGHSDHAGGIPLHATQRALAGLSAPVYHCHPASEAALRNYIWAHDELNAGPTGKFEDSPYILLANGSDRRSKIKKNYLVDAFDTDHTVPSCGYKVFEQKTRMKREYVGLSHEDRMTLVRNGETLSESFEELALAVSGDTRITSLDARPELYEAKILFLECSFLGTEKTPEHAQRWGHIHMDEIVERAGKFKNEHLVLYHFSARYTRDEIFNEAERVIPTGLWDRLHLWANE